MFWIILEALLDPGIQDRLPVPDISGDGAAGLTAKPREDSPDIEFPHGIRVAEAAPAGIHHESFEIALARRSLDHVQEIGELCQCHAAKAKDHRRE